MANKKLKVGHLNARSLSTGFDHFCDLVHFSNVDVMCVTETWVDASHFNVAGKIEIPGFNLFLKNRQGRGGGVGIYIRDCFDGSVVFQDFGPIDDIEYLFVKLKIGRDYYLIGVIYRPPRANLSNCVERMDDFLSFPTI